MPANQDERDRARPPRGQSAAGAEDARDVELSRGGDGEAFARIVRRHQAAVARLLWRFTRDANSHGELVQETFVQAYWSLGGYSGRAPLEHWLARIAVRVGYRFWRTRSLQGSRAGALDPSGDPPDRRPGPAAQIEAAEAAEQVHGLLARLPDRDRLVLTLLYLEERDVREIARLTGWSQAMVKVQAWRARAKLKKLLADVQ